ncbi:hypothetical protein MLD38_039605 [Melastoma candidum]|uniref:Uncharacterized protein n=1 Tax=Melastoma candidum TaxID=119954 RepID=A0ACB9L4C6_9MYRT|nr:hypothetical protein MLD38_039605 [Melastoma candidum]
MGLQLSDSDRTVSSPTAVLFRFIDLLERPRKVPSHVKATLAISPSTWTPCSVDRKAIEIENPRKEIRGLLIKKMAQAASAVGCGVEPSLKEKGNDFFKTGNYLKAAALYTQAIKQDHNNAALYSNSAAAFLHLVKLSKALADTETTINLNPHWDKGYFRKGCVLEAMERYEESLSAFEVALQHNPQKVLKWRRRLKG